MPDSDWPPLQRRLARTARGVMYGCAATAGAAVMMWPPATLTRQLGPVWVYALGAIALVAGATALAAVAAHRWHLEWVAVWQIAGAYIVYTGLEWALVTTAWPHRGIGTAMILTALVACLVGRALDLWVFSLTVGQARTARRAAEVRR